jgi:anti-sigma-K factor RskA
MTDNHLIYKENLAAYAMGALDPEETSALEAHLRTCDSCPAELAQYQHISAGLLAALPPQAPRAAIKKNLQKHLQSQVKANRPELKWSLNRMTIIAAFVLLLGLNIISVYEVYSLKQEQTELDGQYSSQQSAIAMLAYPSTQTFAFDQGGVSGSLLVDKKRNLLSVFAWHLPPAPAGKTYQVWLIDPQEDRTSGGFLIPENNQPFVMAVLKSPQPLMSFVGLGVTLEPAGGSPKPTGPRILRVDF